MAKRRSRSRRTPDPKVDVVVSVPEASADDVSTDLLLAHIALPTFTSTGGDTSVTQGTLRVSQMLDLQAVVERRGGAVKMTPHRRALGGVGGRFR